MTVRSRAGVVILRGEQVAVIERRRGGRLYYVLPGGGVEPGESLEGAAVREAFEELGVGVKIAGLVATIRFAGRGHESEQHYFAAEITRGEFGAGTGPEYDPDLDPAKGTYRATWLSRADATAGTVHPRVLLDAVFSRGLDDLRRAPLFAIETE